MSKTNVKKYLCAIIFIFVFSKVNFSQNLIINGDFSSGNIDFYSDYVYCNSSDCLFPLANNGYSVGSAPSFYHHLFQGSDHTAGSGNMMIVNGAIPSYSVWSQTINVNPSTIYSFSAWVSSLYPSNISQLEFSINSTVIGTHTPSTSVNTWTKFNATWNSSSSTTASIRIRALTPFINGNDFGLDDLFFSSGQIATFTQGTLISSFSIVKDTLCVNQQVNFNNLSDDADSYYWNFGDNNTSTLFNPSHSYSKSGKYTVSLKVTVGNVTSYSYKQLYVLSLPTIELGKDKIICKGDTVALIADSNSDKYNWSNGSFLKNIFVSPQKNTVYFIDVYNNYCSAKDSIKVIINEYSVADFKCDIIDTCNNKYACFATNSLGHNTWYLDDSLIRNESSYFEFFSNKNELKTIKLIKNDKTSCKDSISKTLEVKYYNSIDLEKIPNVFTPNNDGINDFFYIKNINCYGEIELLIYNRWGIKVFNSIESKKIYWDGKNFDDEKLPSGVYFYIIKSANNYYNGNISILD